MPRTAASVAILLIVVISGCSGGQPAAPESSDQDCNLNSLAFWSVDEYRGWASDKLRIGYELSGPANLLLVAHENDTIRGVKHVSTGRAVATDGASLQLDQPLSGEHTIHVLAYQDENDNGHFDQEADSRCSAQTDPLTLNFSNLDGNATA